MKSIGITVLISFLLTFEGNAQISAPYYQSFDSAFSFFSEDLPENPKVPNYSSKRYWDMERWAPRSQSNYTNTYWNIDANGNIIGDPNLAGVKRDLKPYNSINWNEPNRSSFNTTPNSRIGKAIKLTTLDQYDNAGGINDSFRSRTEIKTFPYHSEGSEFYYAWSFLIPDNTEFFDESYEVIGENGEIKTIQDNIIAQWHEEIGIAWENNRDMQPPFFMIYKNDTSRSQNDKSRNLAIMYGFRYDENGNHGDFESFLIPDAIEKGKWNDVIMHIKWSNNPSIAFMEMWINDSTITNSTGDSIFYKANLYRDAATLTPQPNYFKLGQYRQGQTLSQSIYIDEFRIGNTKEEVDLRTSLVPNDCGRLLTYDSMIISCHEVIGAKGYHFYFPDQDEIVHSDSPSIDLAQLNWVTFNTTYNVQCRVALYDESNKIDLFGAICQVTTPPPFKTKLKNEYCGSTLPSNDLTVEAYPIPEATQYKFYVSGVTNPIERSEPNLNLGDYDWFNFNSSYQVSVRVSQPNNAGLINHTGESCTIYSPQKTKLKDGYCGSTLPSNDLTVEAYPIPEATQYKFYVSGVMNPIERSVPNLNLGDYGWFNINSSYQISVRVSEPENAGLINHIGESCKVDVSLPSSRTATEGEFDDDESLEKDFVIYPNPSNGIFSIIGVDDIKNIKLYNLSGQEIQFESINNGQLFSIRTEFKGLILLHLEKEGGIVIHKIRTN